MSHSSSLQITQLLIEWSQGDRAALEKLMSLVEPELHRLAHHFMRRERPGHTLQTTALVNEAYLRLVDQKETNWQNRAHFFAIAGRLMRRIMVDHARSRRYAKRGGEVLKVSLDEAAVVSQQHAAEMLALDEALKSLEAIDPRKSAIVEMRFFGGMSIEETAEVLKVSSKTVVRDWGTAKAWLYRALSGGQHDEG